MVPIRVHASASWAPALESVSHGGERVRCRAAPPSGAYDGSNLPGQCPAGIGQLPGDPPAVIFQPLQSQMSPPTQR
jgi:hypothetical protein